jgi:2-oxoglutarate dehydrogenase E1 component
LRHPDVQSPVEELVSGKFREIIGDPDCEKTKAKRLIFCSGKIFYELKAYQKENDIKEVAIIRIEQLYPFPLKQLKAIKKEYPNAPEWLWVQEEPANMGAWSHILRLTQGIFQFKLLSRKDSASPATGHPKIHEDTQKKLVETAFAFK